MARIDRYLLAQLLALFGFFSLVLVLVYWVNRAVGLFDELIANGQSALVFLEFTALTLPNVIRLVLPISAFAATVYVVNRLSSESELAVVQATGFGPARLARPVLVFGLIVGGLLSVLTHLLVPTSLAIFADRSAEVAENVTAQLLREGTFLHPTEGVTFYIREISPEGEMFDLFLSDARDPARRTTYTAQSALLVRQDGAPSLVMFEGMLQTLSPATQRLATTSFSDFAIDIGALFDAPEARPRGADELATGELFAAPPALVAETGEPRAVLIVEGHERVTQALLAVVAPLVGFAALMVGSFSRFGIWRQIIGAILCLILVETLDNAMVDMARDDAALWPLVYAAPLTGFVLAGALLWAAAHPAIFRWRRTARDGTAA